MTRLINESFVPLISGIKGFEAYYAINTSEDVLASMSVFDTQEGAEQSNQLAEDWVAKNAAKFIIGKYETHEGEVFAHSLAHAVT